MPPHRRLAIQALALLALSVLGGCAACPFLAARGGGNAAGAAHASSAAAAAAAPPRRHLLGSAYPAPTEALAGFLPGTLGASLAAIAKTLAPQTTKSLVDSHVHAAAGWKNVTGADGTDAPAHASRLEAAIAAVRASLAAGKGSAAADAWDGSFPDPPLAFAEELFKLLMYPIPPSLFVRAAFHDCGAWNKAAGALHNDGGGGGVGPNRGGCNGSLRFELHRPSNYGLGLTWPVINFGWKVLQAAYPGAFSRADAVAIAGAGAVRAAFGPVIHVGYGRVDAAGPDPDWGPASNPAAGSAASPADLKAGWLGAWGLSPASLCALLGAHTFGISSVSVPLGAFAPTGPLLFTNAYYRRVVDGTAHFPVDNSLGALPETAACVRAYAGDQAAFFAGFAKEYRAMSWWGTDSGLAVRGIVDGAAEDEWREPA
jgi:L-ascorbate peroxidase